jgi:hypothetical protein
MMSIGHGAMGSPTQLTGGSALGKISFTDAQSKLNDLEKKRAANKVNAPTTATQKAEDKAQDLEGASMPTDEKDPLDWETIIGERLNRFSQLLRSEIVRLQLQALRKKIG